VAAGFIWQLLAPSPKPPVAAPQVMHSSGPTLDVTPLTNLFGAAPQMGGDAPSSLNFKLRGVIAARIDTPAAALFDGGAPPTLAVKAGDELEPGVRLIEVAADHVIVDNHGRRERLDLDALPPAAGIQPADVAPPDNPPESPALPPTSMNERVLNRGELIGGIRGSNVNQWSNGLANGNGGIAVADASAQPLAGVLGLQNGDVITGINGSPMHQKTDIGLLYGVFSRTPRARLDIVRDGNPVTLYYRIENQAQS
jgi:type II secretory pathway component PulC